MSKTNVHKDCLQIILQKKFTKHCFSNVKRLDLKSKNIVNNIVDKFQKDQKSFKIDGMEFFLEN